MKFINKEHFKAAMYGLIVGDALGVPFEFKARDSFKVSGMTGFGTHNQPEGTWSDDSSMVLATLDAFLRSDTLDCDLIMRNFADWLHKGEYTPYGKCFDIGNTTIKAITKFDNGRRPLACGGRWFSDNGNGSLMRILPIAFVEHSAGDINDLSSLTHSHEISLMCCQMYVQLAENLIKGMPKIEAAANLTCSVEECKDIPLAWRAEREKIKSGGFVVDTLEAAVWCFVNTDSYRDCVITAVELGSDTDTVAAIAGGLAGIYYGINEKNGIPDEWLNAIAAKDRIDGLLDSVLMR